MKTMPLSVADFTNRWKIAAAHGSERQNYQQHFLDLCQLLGQPTPVQDDPTHQSYCFERHVTKAGGGKGFADVWKRGFFAWEYKAADRDLNAAYKQLSDYRDALDNPNLLVVSDVNIIRIHTVFENTPQRIYEFTLDDLKAEKATPKSVLTPLELLRALFTDPRKLHPGSTAARVTEEAARKFLQLAQSLESGRLDFEGRVERPTREQIAHFLMRIVFCLFADSIGLLPRHVFRDLIRNSRFLPTKFRKQLRSLFRAMADQDEGYFGEHTISWFNGGLFNDDTTIELTREDLGILAEASLNIDWAHIEPAIFGTLFERSLDVEKRSLIGAHYTSPEDILLLIEPVIIEPLTRRWAEVKQAITETLQSKPQSPGASKEPSAPQAVSTPQKVGAPTKEVGAPPSSRSSRLRWDGSGKEPSGTTSPTQQLPLQTNLQSRAKAETLLAAWITELTSIRVLDPACGSGNFLYMALRRMLDLWKEANDFVREHNMSLVLPGIVSPAQLYGIETDFYAHELSSIVVWIGFLQWNYEHPVWEQESPILRQLTNIQHADAILRYTEDGTPYEPEWPEADYIVGNPPFLGDKKMRRELDTPEHPTYVDDLRKLYNGRVPGNADLVAYWFEKARSSIERKSRLRSGFIATQAIRGATNRPVLDRILQTGAIFWARSDRKWIRSDKKSKKGLAMVQVSMVAFDDGSELTRSLDGIAVETIHSNLRAGVNTTTRVKLNENDGLAFQGPVKVGKFEISKLVAESMLAKANVHERLNSEVVKPWMNGQDIKFRPKERYIINFSDMLSTEAALFEAPFEYLKVKVRPKRSTNKDRQRRENWWRLGRSGRSLELAKQGLARLVITTRHSKHRIFSWASADLVPDSALVAIARDDDYFIGVLQSSIHEFWSRSQGTQVRDAKSGFRYTPESTFQTFPFPWPPGTEPKDDPRVEAIAEAAKNLVDLRDRWLNPPNTSEADLKKRTLTNLYNARPQWLEDAHQTLDKAVFAAYNWPPSLTTQQILENLLTLNHQRAAMNSSKEKGA